MVPVIDLVDQQAHLRLLLLLGLVCEAAEEAVEVEDDLYILAHPADLPGIVRIRDLEVRFHCDVPRGRVYIVREDLGRLPWEGS